MSANSYPLSSFTEAFKSTGAGVLSFFLGLVGGSIIVFSQGISIVNNWAWSWYLCAWIILIPYTIAKLWGLILAPILAIILHGLVWNEWNRLIGGSLVAILLSVTTFVCARHNPFMARDSGRSFVLTMGTAVLILIAGVTWELLLKRKNVRRSPPAGPPDAGHPKGLSLEEEKP